MVRQRIAKPQDPGPDRSSPGETTGDAPEPRESVAESGALLPRPAAATEPTDAELQQGILDALRMGLADVAKTLAAQLEARRAPAGSNVIPMRRRG